ncbi:MAG: hypothetical protein K6A33_05350 [Clostridiales bacterium]|nr:hypothetical protein [Clostridiales bacterium]
MEFRIKNDEFRIGWKRTITRFLFGVVLHDMCHCEGEARGNPYSFTKRTTILDCFFLVQGTRIATSQEFPLAEIQSSQ